MQKSKLFKNKVADVLGLPLGTLLEVTLAIIVVIGLIYLTLNISGIFIGTQEYDSAINNMEALAVRVSGLSNETMLYSIPNNFILVGFSYDDKDVIKTECTQESIAKSRPSICQSKSCLCIYKNYGSVVNWAGKDFDDKGFVKPIKCKVFNEKLIFLSSSHDSNFQGSLTRWKPNDYQSTYHLVIYGICGLKQSLGINKITIEKYKDEERTFIVIKKTV